MIRPLVMLIPDSVSWILGTWAKEIQKWNSDQYEFIIFPFGEIWENEALFSALLAEVDIVHCLSQSVFPKVQEIVRRDQTRKTLLISTIHHIVKFSQIEDCINADKIMTVCQQYRHQLISQNIPEEKLALVYNGVDTNFFVPREKMRARKTLNISMGSFAIGFSAKKSSDHDGRKGVDIFQEVILGLSRRGLNIHLVLTGPGWQEVVDQLQKHGLRVRYFPYLSRDLMPDYYSALDMYLVTARVEGGPVPPMEAMSCETAVISTPVGTMLDHVVDGKNGLLVPIGDVQATLDSVLRLYTDPQLTYQLGVEGRRTIIKHLQWRETLRGIPNLYGDFVWSKNSKRGGSISWADLNAKLEINDMRRWETKNSLRPKLLRKIKKLFRRTI
jgi:glycosyltransferase involved in cell wall biosynthesis